MITLTPILNDDTQDDFYFHDGEIVAFHLNRGSVGAAHYEWKSGALKINRVIDLKKLTSDRVLKALDRVTDDDRIYDVELKSFYRFDPVDQEMTLYRLEDGCIEITGLAPVTRTKQYGTDYGVVEIWFNQHTGSFEAKVPEDSGILCVSIEIVRTRGR